MIGEKDKKCINPWLGLLAIALVCIIIACGILFGFKHPWGRKNRARAGAPAGGSRVNFESPGGNLSGSPDDRLIF